MAWAPLLLSFQVAITATLIAAIVGVALALLRSRMDRSIKDVTGLAAVAGVANLAVIDHQKGAPLTTAAAPDSPRT